MRVFIFLNLFVFFCNSKINKLPIPPHLTLLVFLVKFIFPYFPCLQQYNEKKNVNGYSARPDVLYHKFSDTKKKKIYTG